MKLVTFARTDDAQHVGVVLDDGAIADLTASDPVMFTDMLALIDGGEAALDCARELATKRTVAIDPATVRLLAPLPVPRQLFDCLSFEAHLRNARTYAHVIHGGPPLIPIDGDIPSVFRELPVYYKGNRFSVVGADHDIVCPSFSRHLDYELEFAAVLGRGGRDWTHEEAEAAIFGFMTFNDVSARDQQIAEMRGMLGPSKGKDFDTGNVLGPWLVTKDEVPDPNALRMRAWINGEIVTDSTSAGMLHGFPEIIAYASRDETRHPGEVFGSGTVGGGCGLENGHFLRHDDVIELEVEGLGRQRNRVVFPHEEPA